MQTPLAAAPMSGLLTKAEIAQGSMSNSECLTHWRAHFGLSVYNPSFLKKHRLKAGASKTFQPQRCGLISVTVIETGQPSAELLGQTSWLVLASAIVCKY